MTQPNVSLAEEERNNGARPRSQGETVTDCFGLNRASRKGARKPTMTKIQIVMARGEPTRTLRSPSEMVSARPQDEALGAELPD